METLGIRAQQLGLRGVLGEYGSPGCCAVLNSFSFYPVKSLLETGQLEEQRRQADSRLEERPGRRGKAGALPPGHFSARGGPADSHHEEAAAGIVVGRGGGRGAFHSARARSRRSPVAILWRGRHFARQRGRAGGGARAAAGGRGRRGRARPFCSSPLGSELGLRRRRAGCVRRVNPRNAARRSARGPTSSAR